MAVPTKGLIKFSPDTKLPIAAIMPINRLKRKFSGGVPLDADQEAALECFDSLPHAAQSLLLQNAKNGKMDYIPGKDLIEVKGMFTGSQTSEGLLTVEAEGDEDGAERTSVALRDTTEDDDDLTYRGG